MSMGLPPVSLLSYRARRARKPAKYGRTASDVVLAQYHVAFRKGDTWQVLAGQAQPSCEAAFGGSKASTRSSNFETPSAFETKSTWMAAHRESIFRSVIVNRMIGVSGISFLRTVAASAPFNLGMATSRSIKSGCDVLAFQIA